MAVHGRAVEVHPGRRAGKAGREGAGTARAEDTGGAQVLLRDLFGGRRATFETGERLVVFFVAGAGGEQSFRVGMARFPEELRAVALFHDFAAVEDEDTVRDFFERPHVVRDKKQREILFALTALQERENLVFQGEVESRRRLVSDEQFGLLMRTR